MLTLIATGGTIASVERPGGRGVAADGAALLKSARRVWDLPRDVEVCDTRALISSALRLEDLVALAAAADRAHPVVITHGTDAMEETAIFLALQRDFRAPPVVLTGSQRPYDDPSPDGPRNLAAAIRWASSPAALGTGVSVVFGDEVFPGIGVRKTHTLALNGFSAPGRGSFAVVDEAGVRKFACPPAPAPLLRSPAELAPVHILTAYLDMGTDLVDYVLELPRPALVVDAMGAGNLPPPITERVAAAAAQGVPVLITSRTGAGATADLYAGGGADLARAGAVFAGDLSAVQARWALAAALAEPENWRTNLKKWLREAAAVSSPPS